jgi:hypothetical protein
MNSDFSSLGSISGAITANALLFAAAHGVGGSLLRTRTLRPSMDSFLVRISVGLGLIAAIGVTLGAAKCLSQGRSVWLLIALSLLNFAGLLHRKDFRLARRPLHSLRHRWAWLPAAALLLITLGSALSYPTGWDELVYHHELPKRWLAGGWPAFYSDLPYSGFPSLGEILFWLMAPIEHVIAPRLLTWICWIIGLVLVYRLLRRRLRGASAAVMTLCFAGSSTLLLISANCYVETIQMMNFAGMLLVLGAGKRGRNRIGVADWRKPVVVGVLAGGAAAVKLTGLPIVIVPLIYYASELLRRQPRFAAIGHAAAPYLIIALVIACPFYLRPWYLTGNPFYPYYAQFFSQDPERLEMSRYHHALGAAFGVHGPAGFVAGPVLLAFDQQLYDGTFGWQSPIFVALALLALWQARRSQSRLFVAADAALFCLLYCFWFLTAQQARFAIPAILSLTLLAAAGLRKLRGRQRQVVLAAIVTAAAISAPWRTAGHYFGSWLSVSGIISRADYVNELTAPPRAADEHEYLPLILTIAEKTPPDARLLVLFEHRSFYIPRQCTIGTPFFQEAVFTPPEPFSDPARIMEILRNDGISHVVMAKKPLGPDRAGQWFDRFDPLLAGIAECAKQGKLRGIWESNLYIVFEVAEQ